jgi:hypothetical protein
VTAPTRNFDDWYADECRIAAAELVGSNGHEYDGLVERFEEDDGRREVSRRIFLATRAQSTPQPADVRADQPTPPAGQPAPF